MNGFLAACKTAANDHSPAVCQAWQQPAGIYLSLLPEMSASSQVTAGLKTTPFLSDRTELTRLFKAASGKI